MSVLGKYPEIEIIRGQHSIQVKNSYLVLSDTDKNSILDFIIDLFPKYPRTKKSMFSEWKAHNILYKRGYMKERTRDVDFEEKVNLFYRVGYFLISLFLKERKN